ncbi:hypothetical protein ACOSQ2_004752 [Xanthoceras sorbifolium]
MKKLPVLDMHLELPSKDEVSTLYAKDKRGSLILGEPLDDGSLSGHDYSPLLSDGEENIAISDGEEEDNLVDDEVPMRTF